MLAGGGGVVASGGGEGGREREGGGGQDGAERRGGGSSPWRSSRSSRRTVSAAFCEQLMSTLGRLDRVQQRFVEQDLEAQVWWRRLRLDHLACSVPT